MSTYSLNTGQEWRTLESPNKEITRKGKEWRYKWNGTQYHKGIDWCQRNRSRKVEGILECQNVENRMWETVITLYCIFHYFSWHISWVFLADFIVFPGCFHCFSDLFYYFSWLILLLFLAYFISFHG